MALKRLTTEEMVQLTGPWCSERSESRQAILAVPEIAGILPRVEAAHNALHAAQPTASNPRLGAIAVEAAKIDDRHDAVVRGVDLVLEGLALLAGQGARGDALDAARTVLTPAGLSVTNATYRAESGAAALLKTRLAGDGETKKLLKEIPVQKKNLGDYVNERIAAGDALGKLEDERAALQSALPPGEGAKVITARNQWIRAVNALVANAELAEITPEVDTLVLSALRQAEKKADRRTKAPAEEAPSPAPPAPAEPAGA